MPLVRGKLQSSQAEAPDVEKLVAILSNGTEDERWSAARSSAMLPDGVAVLQAALPREPSSRVREAIFTGLARIRTPESAAAVLGSLRSDDPSLRTGALDALRAMPDAAAPHIVGLLNDSDRDVRLLACELVRYQPTNDANKWLSELLAREPDSSVCAAAIEVVAETCGPEMLAPLSACAGRFPNDPFLGFAIRAARARIGKDASAGG